MLVSVVITTKNEEKNIGDLLESLVIQEKPFEVVIVDSESRDGTQNIIKKYAEKHDEIKLYIKRGKRGECMNYAVKKAKGGFIVFLGADCIVDKSWLKEIKKMSQCDIMMGKIINVGSSRFKGLERMELYHKGYEITYPGCNTGYKKDVFENINGFDPWFVTAEDIDLNYRAVNAGYKIVHNKNVVIYHKIRNTFSGIFKQAFWNGYGRKQLTIKHGRLWEKYKPMDMIKKNMSFWYFCRLSIGLLGYFVCKFFCKRPEIENNS